MFELGGLGKRIFSASPFSLSFKDSKILVLGVAYKKNVDDYRESPSIDLIEHFEALGADIHYSDPLIPEFIVPNSHTRLSSVDITPENLSQFDAVVISTNHDSVDWSMVLEKSHLILDTRGVYDVDHANVVRA